MAIESPILTISSTGIRYTGTTLSASPDYPRRIITFYNVPYASAPRFTAPTHLRIVPPGLTPADSEALIRRCPSTGADKASPDTDENLTAHIYRAADTRGKVPAVLFFHGGSFNFGDPLTRDLRAVVAKAKIPMVAVGVRYRLGAIAFPGIDAVANLGILDAKIAVEWVHKNADAIGIDETNITLSGVSAGAHLIGHLLLSYAPAPLPFARVSLESGAPMARATFSPNHPRVLAQFRALCNELSLPDDISGTEALGRVQDVHWSVITQAAGRVWAEEARALTWPFQPVVDGRVIKEGPSVAWKERTLDVDILTGFCMDEGATFVPVDMETEEDFVGYFRNLIAGITEEDLEELVRVYPGPEVAGSPYGREPPEGCGRQWWRLQRAYGDWAYKCPVLLMASESKRVRVYEWAAVSGPKKVAGHTEESLAVEGKDGGKEGMRKVAKVANGLFIGFMTGVIDEEDVEWPWFGEEGKKWVMVFGEGNDELAGGEEKGVPWKLRELSKEEEGICRFWWDRRYLSENMGKQHTEQ